MPGARKPRRGGMMNELHLFAGAGGGILGGILLGHTCICAVEIEPYCRQVLLARQRDGLLPRFPIWDDVRTFDGRPWQGHVDVVCGGFPCQDISTAGSRRGIGGERSGLWGEMARIIGEIRPRYAFVENSAALVVRGLDVVLGDLAALGFDAAWGVFSAADVGAQHQRERIWILANALPVRKRRLQCYTKDGIARHEADEVESEPARVVDAVAHRMDRIDAIGNGQVPAVAALAWRHLMGE